MPCASATISCAENAMRATARAMVLSESADAVARACRGRGRRESLDGPAGHRPRRARARGIASASPAESAAVDRPTPVLEPTETPESSNTRSRLGSGSSGRAADEEVTGIAARRDVGTFGSADSEGHLHLLRILDADQLVELALERCHLRVLLQHLTVGIAPEPDLREAEVCSGEGPSRVQPIDLPVGRGLQEHDAPGR